MANRPMNVLILMSDQHRAATTGCYGESHVATPHLDGLAAQGTLFENAYCTAPLCGPSRGSFLTGTHPHTNGSVTHGNSRHRSGKCYRPQLAAGVHGLAGCLRDAGYRTHASGYVGVHFYEGERSLASDRDFLGFQTLSATGADYKRHVGEKVSRRYSLAGIHGEMWEPSYFNVEGEPFPYGDDKLFDSFVAEDAKRFLQEHDAAQPFCLYLGFRAVHPPWCAPAAFHSRYDPNDIGPLPDYQSPPPRGKPRRVIERHHYFDIPHYTEDMVRRSIAGYHAFVSYLDDCIGRVLSQLDDLGLRDNTLIIYSSDHGENLYRHGLCEKHTFYEDAVRVPLIFSMPGVVPEGRRTESLASGMDLLPTVLAMAGVEAPEFVEGCDLQPAMRGETVHEHVFAEYYHSLDPCRMVRDQRYKYIHTEEDICELYDLHHDPEERFNLAWYPQYAELVERMDQLVMADWEIPELPAYAPWNDLNERKQRQRLQGLDIIDVRPEPPTWVREGPAPVASQATGSGKESGSTDPLA
ncbi:MAG: sulfatase [Phycisphaeraceae bacterium]